MAQNNLPSLPNPLQYPWPGCEFANGAFLASLTWLLTALAHLIAG